MMEKIAKVDVLIADVDDTLVYHQTVASANRLFVVYLSRFFRKELSSERMFTTFEAMLESFRLFFLNIFNLLLLKVEWMYMRKMIILFFVGLRLHISNIYRSFFNRFRRKDRIISSERMLRRWGSAIVSLEVDAKDYFPGEITTGDRIALRYVREIRRVHPKVKVVGITQSFYVDKSKLVGRLGLDYLFSNRFIVRKGKIVSYSLDVKDGNSKLKTASKFAVGNKKIGIIIDNYEDVQLIDLKNLKFILYRRRLWRFVRDFDGERVGF